MKKPLSIKIHIFGTPCASKHLTKYKGKMMHPSVYSVLALLTTYVLAVRHDLLISATKVQHEMYKTKRKTNFVGICNKRT